MKKYINFLSVTSAICFIATVHAEPYLEEQNDVFATNFSKIEPNESSIEFQKNSFIDSLLEDESYNDDISHQNMNLIERQISLINNEDIFNPKTVQLRNLTEKGIVLTNKSIQELEKNFNTGLIRVNLFDSDNFIMATKFAIEEATNLSKADKNMTVALQIEKNPQLKDFFGYISNQLNTLTNMTERNLNNEEYSKVFMDLYNSLRQSYLLLKHNYEISKNNYFTHFIYDVIRAQQVIIARHLSSQIMKLSRMSVESDIQRSGKSGEISFSVGVPLPISFGVKNTTYANESSDTSSFYTINVGNRLRLSISADVKFASAEAGVSANLMNSYIFYSLEQLIDSGRFDIRFSKDDLKKIVDLRKQMQEREAELLARFGELEGFYKIFKVLPQPVYMDWIEISKSDNFDNSTTHGITADANASLISLLGGKIDYSVNHKTYAKQLGVSSLLSDDCSCSNGLTSQELKELVGEKFDLSEKLVLPQVLYGHLMAYNSILEQLANNHSSLSEKELKNKKSAYEDLLLPKKGFFEFKNLGRAGVLKSAVVTAAIMRDYAKTEEEILMFKKIQEQIQRLSKLQMFSNSYKGERTLVESVAHSSSEITSGEIKLDIPFLDSIGLSFKLIDTKESPFLDENGNYSTIRLLVPSSGALNFVGQKLVEKIKDMNQNSVDSSEENIKYKDLCNALEIVTDLFVDFKENSKKPIDIGFLEFIPFVSEAGNDLLLDVTSVKVNPVSCDLIPLPNQNLVSIDQEKWALQDVKRTLMNFVGVDVGLDSFGVGGKGATTDKKIIIGDDTISVITSKYNAFRLGSIDSQENTAWESFKTSQEKSLLNILKNITDDSKTAKYELQVVYNSIMKNLQNESDKNDCFKSFDKLLKNCQTFDENTLTSKISKSLDKVLELNFLYNFLPHYNNSYKV